jgi:hypothetical protein
MRINVHIERLILDGLPVRTSQGRVLQASIERELARLLAGDGLASEVLAGRAVASLPHSTIEITTDAPPTVIARQIAEALNRQIGNHNGCVKVGDGDYIPKRAGPSTVAGKILPHKLAAADQLDNSAHVSKQIADK